jgi:hypothetical protein
LWDRKHHVYDPHRTRKWRRKRFYGLTDEQFHAMLQSQAYACALCGDAFKTTKDYNVDHDHTTGLTRAILCSHCNTGLGQFRDDSTLMRRAADYLDRHKERHGLALEFA